MREVSQKNNKLQAMINELKDKTYVFDGWIEDLDSLQKVDINRNVSQQLEQMEQIEKQKEEDHEAKLPDNQKKKFFETKTVERQQEQHKIKQKMQADRIKRL